MAETTINLRCAFCGNAMRVLREKHDPAAAVEMVTNECSVCEAANGGWGSADYLDRDGNTLDPLP